MILRSTAKGWCVVPRPKSQIISALFSTTYDFAVLKMGLASISQARLVLLAVRRPVLSPRGETDPTAAPVVRMAAVYRRLNGSSGEIDSLFGGLRSSMCDAGKLAWAAQRWIGPLSRGVRTPRSVQSCVSCATQLTKSP